MDCISDVITDQIDNKTEQKTGILRSDLIFSMIGFYKPVFSLVKEVLYKSVLTSERKNIWKALSTVSTVSCLLDRFGDDNNLMFRRKIKYRLVTKITTTAWKETFQKENQNTRQTGGGDDILSMMPSQQNKEMEMMDLREVYLFKGNVYILFLFIYNRVLGVEKFQFI